MILTLNHSAFAADVGSIHTERDPALETRLVIIDPDTGESWAWNIPSSELDMSASEKSCLRNGGGFTQTLSVTLDVSEYLAATLKSPTVEASQRVVDNVILVAG